MFFRVRSGATLSVCLNMMPFIISKKADVPLLLTAKNMKEFREDCFLSLPGFQFFVVMINTKKALCIGFG